MKVSVIKEEWWPVYMAEVYDPEYPQPTDLVEIPDELYQRYVKASEEFELVQELLKPYCKK